MRINKTDLNKAGYLLATTSNACTLKTNIKAETIQCRKIAEPDRKEIERIGNAIQSRFWHVMEGNGSAYGLNPQMKMLCSAIRGMIQRENPDALSHVKFIVEKTYDKQSYELLIALEAVNSLAQKKNESIANFSFEGGIGGRCGGCAIKANGGYYAFSSITSMAVYAAQAAINLDIAAERAGFLEGVKNDLKRMKERANGADLPGKDEVENLVCDLKRMRGEDGRKMRAEFLDFAASLSEGRFSAIDAAVKEIIEYSLASKGRAEARRTIGKLPAFPAKIQIDVLDSAIDKVKCPEDLLFAIRLAFSFNGDESQKYVFLMQKARRRLVSEMGQPLKNDDGTKTARRKIEAARLAVDFKGLVPDLLPNATDALKMILEDSRYADSEELKSAEKIIPHLPNAYRKEFRIGKTTREQDVEAMVEIYRKEWKDEKEQSTNLAFKDEVFKAIVKGMETHAECKAGMKILEIGSARGELAEEVAKALNAKMYTSDAACGKLNCTDRGIRKRHLIARAENLPYPGKKFDALMGVHFLEYTIIEETVAEMHRVSKDNGMAVLILHHPESKVLKKARNLAEDSAKLIRFWRLMEDFLDEYVDANGESNFPWKTLEMAGKAMHNMIDGLSPETEQGDYYWYFNRVTNGSALDEYVSFRKELKNEGVEDLIQEEMRVASVYKFLHKYRDGLFRTKDEIAVFFSARGFDVIEADLLKADSDLTNMNLKKGHYKIKETGDLIGWNVVLRKKPNEPG